MNCPFCHKQLVKDPDGCYTCYTDNCAVMRAGGNGASGSLSLWLKVIQMHKQLQKAQDALIKEKTTHNILQERLTEHQKALEHAIGVLDNLAEIGGVDMEIIKIKKMAGIK